MKSLDKAEDAVRVERGAADESEVAAVVVVLLSRLAACRRTAVESSPGDTGETRPWWEGTETYRAPRSWC